MEGYIKVTNRAAIVGSFLVGYKINGKDIFSESPYLAVLQSYTIKIPTDATDIGFLSFMYDDFSGDILIARYNFISPPRKCYNFYGTIFNPSCKEVSCNGDGGNGGDPDIPDIPDPPVCKPCCCCCCHCHYHC